MTYAPVTIVGQQLANAMSPWLNDQLAWYLDAIGAEFQQVALITQDVGSDNTVGFNSAINGYGVVPYVSGYSTIFNPNTCPSAQLGYLGQFVGVAIPAGQDATTARMIVQAESGLARGTPAAIIAAAKRNLTGTQSCLLFERTRADGNLDPYWFLLQVRPEECASQANLKASVNAVKPGGVDWQLVVTDGWTITQMEASVATLTLLEANFRTLAGLEADAPGD